MFCFVSRIAAVLLLVVAGTLAPAAAGERRITATGAGGYNSGYMYARFEATHLGKANFIGFVAPYVLENPTILEIPVDLTAANGDRLYLDSIVDYDIDYDTGIRIAIGTLTFTGGTGRFQAATGSADVMFVFDFNLQHFLFLIDGSIDY